MEVIKKEKRIQEVTVVTEQYTLCDKCNEKIETDRFEAFDCTFEYKTGEQFPDAGSGERHEMQLCQKCAPELVALLEANGYRINKSNWDY